MEYLIPEHLWLLNKKDRKIIFHIILIYKTTQSFRSFLEMTPTKHVSSLNWSLREQLRLFSEVTESLSHLAQELLPQQDSKSNATCFTISVLYFV